MLQENAKIKIARQIGRTRKNKTRKIKNYGRTRESPQETAYMKTVLSMSWPIVTMTESGCVKVHAVMNIVIELNVRGGLKLSNNPSMKDKVSIKALVKLNGAILHRLKNCRQLKILIKESRSWEWCTIEYQI